MSDTSTLSTPADGSPATSSMMRRSSSHGSGGSGSGGESGGGGGHRGRARSRSFILEDDDDDLLSGGGPPDVPEPPSAGDFGGGGDGSGDDIPRGRSRSRSFALEPPMTTDASSDGRGRSDTGLEPVDAGRGRAGTGTGQAPAGLSQKTISIITNLDPLSATGHSPPGTHLGHHTPVLPHDSSSGSEEEAAEEREIYEKERRKQLADKGLAGAGRGGTGGGASGGASGSGSGGGGGGDRSDGSNGKKSSGKRSTSKSKGGKSGKGGKGKKNKEPEHDMVIKLLLLGDGGVGKTSLIKRLSDNKFTTSMIQTAGVDFSTKYMDIAGKKVKCQIWDTAGQERFHVITRAYYRGANGIILVYDAHEEAGESFSNVTYWMDNIRQHAAPSVEKILVANKVDLPRKIDKARGKAMADEYGVRFFEASAKDGTNVSKLFKAVATDIVTRHTLGEGPKLIDPDVTAPDTKPRCSIM